MMRNELRRYAEQALAGPGAQAGSTPGVAK
jgi:hypothetical protein